MRDHWISQVRLVGSKVLQHDLGADGDVGEVDDHVGALRRPQQEPRELDRDGQEATLGAELPERQPVAQLEDQEPRVAAVEEAEPVAPLLDL
jgi:hypothetical protein